MSDAPLPPDPGRLRVLELWLRLELDRVREALAAAEAREAAEAARPRWWVQWDRLPPGRPKRGTLHRAGCWRPGEPVLDDEGLRRLLAAHEGRIVGCDVCETDSTHGLDAP